MPKTAIKKPKYYLEKKYYLECMKCHGHAFYLSKMPKKDEIISAEDVIHADNPSKYDLIKCQECKQVLDMGNISVVLVKKNI